MAIMRGRISGVNLGGLSPVPPRAAAKPALVCSRMRLRSNSATALNILKINSALGCGGVELKIERTKMHAARL